MDCRIVVSATQDEYELDEFNTTKEHIVKILVYAALLSLLVSRELLALVTECAEDEAVIPTRALGSDLPIARPAHP